MDSIKSLILVGILCVIKISADSQISQGGIRPSNILGGTGQHASFSFVRPGLTQTSYSFNGPSSHQAFSSSIGNPHLAQKVLPNVAQALAYRNPGLGYFSNAPITTAYASTNHLQYPHLATQNSAPVSHNGGQIVYQGNPIRPIENQVDQANALAYLQQQYRQQYLQSQQQYQPQNLHPTQEEQSDATAAAYQQAQIAQIHALRQQAQAQTQSSHEQLQQIPEQIQLQQEQEQQHQTQTQNLLGVAYSSAPSVAHVKVSGNGYNFDF